MFWTCSARLVVQVIWTQAIGRARRFSPRGETRQPKQLTIGPVRITNEDRHVPEDNGAAQPSVPTEIDASTSRGVHLTWGGSEECGRHVWTRKQCLRHLLLC